jgi:hypothetical protein
MSNWYTADDYGITPDHIGDHADDHDVATLAEHLSDSGITPEEWAGISADPVRWIEILNAAFGG